MASFIDNYKLYLLQGNDKYDFTNVVGAFSWGSDIDTLSSSLSFSIISTCEPKCKIGDKLILTNNGKLIFKGVVTNTVTNKNEIQVSSNDYAWYLNKSSLFIQFKKISVSDAIKQLLSKFSIPIDSIFYMKTTVNKSYTDMVISDIISDLIQMYTKETGVKVRSEMINGKFRVYAVKDEVINPSYKPTSNLQDFKSFDYIGDDWTIKKSIEDMTNSVLVKQGNKIMHFKNQEAINKYGLLQETIDVDGTDISKAKNDAKNILADKSSVTEDVECTVLGDDSIIAGRSVVLTSLNNSKYLIKSANHTYNGSSHIVSVQLVKGGL